MASNSHRLSREQIHYGWDNSIEPALTVTERARRVPPNCRTGYGPSA